MIVSVTQTESCSRAQLEAPSLNSSAPASRALSICSPAVAHRCLQVLTCKAKGLLGKLLLLFPLFFPAEIVFLVLEPSSLITRRS